MLACQVWTVFRDKIINLKFPVTFLKQVHKDWISENRIKKPILNIINDNNLEIMFLRTLCGYGRICYEQDQDCYQEDLDVPNCPFLWIS